MADFGLTEGPKVITQNIDPKLAESFDSFFKEEDEKAPIAPAAPESDKEVPSEVEPVESRETPEVKEEPQEKSPKRKRLTESTKAPTEREISEFIDGVPETPPAKVEPATPAPVKTAMDEQVEKALGLEIHSDASPERKNQWKELKTILNSVDEQRKSAEQARTNAETKLALYDKYITPAVREIINADIQLVDPDEAKWAEAANTIRSMKGKTDPQTAQELEAYRVIGRQTALDKSLTYERSFKQPIQQGVSAWADKASQYLNCDPAVAKEWASKVKEKISSDINAVNSNWFLEQMNILAGHKRIDQMAYDRLWDDAKRLTAIKEEGDKISTEIAADPFTYQKWQQVENEALNGRYKTEVSDEVERAFKTDLAPLAYIRESPEFPQLEATFQNVLQQCNAGPRQQARLGIFLVHLMEHNKSLQKQLDETRELNGKTEKEKNQYMQEAKLKRKLADAVLNPGAGHASPKSAPEKARLTLSKNPDWKNLGS